MKGDRSVVTVLPPPPPPPAANSPSLDKTPALPGAQQPASFARRTVANKAPLTSECGRALAGEATTEPNGEPAREVSPVFPGAAQPVSVLRRRAVRLRTVLPPRLKPEPGVPATAGAAGGVPPRPGQGPGPHCVWALSRGPVPGRAATC